MLSVPDSAYLFAYATDKNENHNGLHFAWSVDGKKWSAIGPERSFLTCDYGRWGTEKRMLDPFLYQSPEGEWHCFWDVNERDRVVASATSSDLVHWKPQVYRKNETYPKERDEACIAGVVEKGSLHKVAWPLIESLINEDRLANYKRLLNEETTQENPIRFASLKPLTAKIKVEAGQPKAISDLLLGVFFEDISYAADGGLYAEWVQNRDFEYALSDKEGKDPEWNSTYAWDLLTVGKPSGTEVDAAFFIDSIEPLHPNNLHYASLHVTTPGVTALTNSGFDGIPVKKGEKFDFSLFSKVKKGKGGKLRIRLVDRDGRAVAETTVSAVSAQWKQQSAVLTARADADSASLHIIPEAVSVYGLDMISLFPQQTFKGRKNGLRADLAQAIADLHPRFVRFPGGCVAHGDGLDNIYRWKNTIGRWKPASRNGICGAIIRRPDWAISSISSIAKIWVPSRYR